MRPRNRCGRASAAFADCGSLRRGRACGAARAKDHRWADRGPMAEVSTGSTK